MHDKFGKVVEDIGLQAAGPCISIDWDRDGEYLVILQQGLSRCTVVHSFCYHPNGNDTPFVSVHLWNANRKSTETIETNMKELSVAVVREFSSLLINGSFSH